MTLFILSQLPSLQKNKKLASLTRKPPLYALTCPHAQEASPVHPSSRDYGAAGTPTAARHLPALWCFKPGGVKVSVRLLGGFTVLGEST
jgi:hypothetical protein